MLQGSLGNSSQNISRRCWGVDFTGHSDLNFTSITTSNTPLSSVSSQVGISVLFQFYYVQILWHGCTNRGERICQIFPHFFPSAKPTALQGGTFALWQQPPSCHKWLIFLFQLAMSPQVLILHSMWTWYIELRLALDMYSPLFPSNVTKIQVLEYCAL